MLTFWFAWVLADFLGALVGASFPHIEKYGLDFAMVAAFIAIVVPQIKSQACTVAAVVAAVSGGTFGRTALLVRYRRRVRTGRNGGPERRSRRRA